MLHSVAAPVLHASLQDGEMWKGVGDVDEGRWRGHRVVGSRAWMVEVGRGRVAKYGQWGVGEGEKGMRTMVVGRDSANLEIFTLLLCKS